MEHENPDGMNDFERLEHDHETYRRIRMRHLKMALCGSKIPVADIMGRTMVVAMFSLPAFAAAFPNRERRAVALGRMASDMDQEAAMLHGMAEKFTRGLASLLRKLDRMRGDETDEPEPPKSPAERDPWEPGPPQQGWLFSELAEDNEAAAREKERAAFDAAVREARARMVDPESMRKCLDGDMTVDEELALRRSLGKSPASLQTFCEMLGERVRQREDGR